MRWRDLRWAVVLAFTSAAAFGQTPPPGGERELVVFAAASLRDAFTELASRLEATNPGVRVRFNFAGSQDLRTQLEHGARADVFASADQKHMDGAKAAGLVKADRLLVTNLPVVVVPVSNPAGLKAFADLPRAKRVVIGTPEVPIGSYTLEILDRASRTLGAGFRKDVEARVVSRELNVRQILAKVVLAEADAGFVYRTDAQSAAEKVTQIPIPQEFNVVAVYPIAILEKAPAPKLAEQWMTLVTSPEGQAVLSRFGFTPAASAAAHRP
ncbi:MAG TPA: molybdate ABC transporter substrate-binding protein [Myxococcaceae bacterium]|nr:molybdate ABC transporter substrate-binding protein [Myxococcaceae bacterium]